MTALMAVLALSGLCTYYGDGLMDAVADYRGMELDGYDGGVALNDCRELGRVVWLEWVDGDVTKHLVVDCAQRGHVQARESAGYVAEVSWDVAVRRGFAGVGPVPVTVWEWDPVMRRRPL